MSKEMKETQDLLVEIFEKDHFVEGVLSNVRKRSLETYSKVTIRPVMLKAEYTLQLTYHYEKKVLHENLTQLEAVQTVSKLLGGYFKQGQLFTATGDYQILSNKSGDLKVLKQKASKTPKALAHNKQKQYVLEEGTPIDFLVALGIMSKDGKVLKAKYAKFRQINKYLEILEDAIQKMRVEGEVKVVDFGCGKAYLTFAMHYYFVQIKKLKVDIVGLDLKADVISDLRLLRDNLGYEGLRFEQGDIQNFEWDKKPDIVVSLHACDTATDAAIAKAINWQAQVIMAVPCCQHELFDQIKNPKEEVLLKHGILKERFSALATDAVRAAVMSLHGYQTVVMEFIDMEHTPKNLMLRGRYEGPLSPEKYQAQKALIEGYLSLYQIQPSLVKFMT